MKPGIKIKRWIFLGFVGVVVLVLGVVEIFSNKDYEQLYKSFIFIFKFNWNCNNVYSVF